MPNLPALLRDSLIEGVTVIGWVALWRPTEMILDELGTLLKRGNVYRKLNKAPIRLKADDGF